MSQERKEYNRQHYENNREKYRENAKRWRQEHPERYRETAKRWRQEHPEKRNEINKRWQQTQPERYRESVKRWRQTHPEKRKAMHYRRRIRELNAPGDSFTDYEWKMLCADYDQRCLKCGQQKPLTADHVVPLAHGGSGSIDNIQPLCLSCNSSKGIQHTDYRVREPIKVEQLSLFGAIEP